MRTAVFLLWMCGVFAGARGALAGVLQTGAGGAAAGTDLSARIEAEDARLGATKGVIRLDRPGRIGREVTLGAGHDLLLTAAVQWDATVHLKGQNRVSCGGGGRIEAGTPGFVWGQPKGALLLAQGVAGVSVDGCAVRGVAQSVLLAGLPASDVEMSGNQLTGMTLLATNDGASARLKVMKNTVTMPGGGSTNAALLLFFAEGVEASGNTFTGVVHGVQWWGGNAGDAGANLGQVTRAGQMLFVGNVCKAVDGSCIWGSMGHDIVMRGNTADGCGDVCFDTEGGLRTEISGNTATGCKNGCAAIFFFTDQTSIVGNHFSGAAPGGGLLFIKNASQDPARHDHLRIEDNDLVCAPAICRVMYQEAAGGITFQKNRVTDGTWQPAGYARSVAILENTFVFRQGLRAGEAAIEAPDVIGDTALRVEGNVVRSTVAQPAGTTCLRARWSDYNASDRHLIDGNRCEGVGGGAAFPAGLAVVSAGKNPGPTGIWIAGWNDFGGGTVTHVAEPGSKEAWLDLATDAGAVRTAAALPGCTGAAPATNAMGEVPVCLGGREGWVMGMTRAPVQARR